MVAEAEREARAAAEEAVMQMMTKVQVTTAMPHALLLYRCNVVWRRCDSRPCAPSAAVLHGV